MSTLSTALGVCGIEVLMLLGAGLFCVFIFKRPRKCPNCNNKLKRIYNHPQYPTREVFECSKCEGVGTQKHVVTYPTY